jgi:hypothetical protein
MSRVNNSSIGFQMVVRMRKHVFIQSGMQAMDSVTGISVPVSYARRCVDEDPLRQAAAAYTNDAMAWTTIPDVDIAAIKTRSEQQHNNNSPPINTTLN